MLVQSDDVSEDKWRSSRRVALVTPEFVTEDADSGGLGSYLYRFAKALRDAGYQPEVFVTSRHPAASFSLEDIRVHRVGPTLLDGASWRLHGILGRSRLRWVADTIENLQKAYVLANALARRERAVAYRFVQSADFLGAGIFVRQGSTRPHLVRCSSAADMYAAAESDTSFVASMRMRLEFASVRRSDIAYAPSRLVASHIASTVGRPLAVIRSPALLSATPAAETPVMLPSRYFLHFGQLRVRKGTDCLIDALTHAFREAPEMNVVCMGKASSADVERWTARLGPWRDRVTWLTPQPRDVVNAVLAGAIASVVPSLVDNIPNTALESLMAGVPVIGSIGASVDELVTHDLTGQLVPKGDALALANALVRFWSDPPPVRKGFDWLDSPIGREFRPERAVSAVIEMVDAWHGDKSTESSHRGRGHERR